jgi:truncated hemoglobin YjbI
MLPFELNNSSDAWLRQEIFLKEVFGSLRKSNQPFIHQIEKHSSFNQLEGFQ